MIADFCNIPIDNVKNLAPNFFDKEKYVLHYENLELYLRLGLKLQSITISKAICRIQQKKNNRGRRKWRQRWKSVVQVNEQCGVW